MKVLIAHSQSDFRSTLEQCLRNAFPGPQLIVDEAWDEPAVAKKIKDNRQDPYNFLVISLDLAISRDLPQDQARRGLRIVKKLRGASRKTTCLLIMPAEMPADTILQFPGTSSFFITERTEMFQDIIAAIRSALSRKKVQQRLSLNMVQDPNSPNWNFWLEGGGSSGFQEARGSFPIPTDLISGLTKRSKQITDDPTRWLDALADIGRELWAMIFEWDPDFKTQFKAALESVGGVDHMRFSFDVSQNNYSLAVEALVDHDSVKRKVDARELPFIMLKAPICRSLTLNSPSRALGGQIRPPLFTGQRKPINCLIIDANVARKAKKGKCTFYELPNVTKDCKKLYLRLKRNKKRWHLGEIKRITRETVPRGKSFKQELHKELTKGEWHLIHFSGHSYYRPGSDGGRAKGYLVLPGKQPEMLDARVFAHWLDKTQFLFLSSCRSSEEAFAFEMARNHVPAVLGFRWDVDDRFVPRFVTSFYDNLFRQRSIESAFVAARRCAKEKHADDPVWAAPVLVLLQPERTAAAAA